MRQQLLMMIPECRPHACVIIFHPCLLLPQVYINWMNFFINLLFPLLLLLFLNISIYREVQWDFRIAILCGVSKLYRC